MILQTTSPSSRRALLVGATGGAVALVAQALGRPEFIRAGTDGDVVLGQPNESTGLTTITNAAGTGGLQGSSTGSGTGLFGASSSGDGVSGRSDAGTGVFGYSNSATAAAVLGQAAESVGVQGYVGPGFPARVPGVGVYGSGPYAGLRGVSENPATGFGVVGEARAGDSGQGGIGVYGYGAAFGVRAESPLGIGVQGVSGDGSGVDGQSGRGNGVTGSSHYVGVSGYSAGLVAVGTGVQGHCETGGYGVTGNTPSGVGVLGQSDSGIGVQAHTNSGTALSAHGGTGTALVADGPVQFSSATLATIPAGSSSVTVSPGMDLTGQSKVLCTLQSDPGAKAIKYVLVDPTADSYDVVLTSKTQTPISVACFVIS